ncbi:MAG: PLP-dependent aminotransferase family protein, partial [Burkholderia sp.]|nr:PLP-dependent aminotransferase family protein [Burkholderia sp.]
DRHLRKLRGALHAQLNRMDDALRRWLPPGVEWVRPDGGYFLWLAFPDAIDAMELHRQAIARGISFAPGPLFSAAHGFERCVRVNFGHPWSRDIERAIRVLGELVAQPSVRKAG